MAMITNAPGGPSLKETLIALILDVNAALWHIRKDQNTGDGSSPGIQVLLPTQLEVEVVFGADGSISSIDRVQEQTQSGSNTTTKTTSNPGRTTTTTTESTKTGPDVTETSEDFRTNLAVTTTTNEAGGDRTVVNREYEEPG
jgi:hypothetical protein